MSKTKIIETELVNGVYVPKNAQTMTDTTIVKRRRQKIAVRKQHVPGLSSVKEMLQGIQGFTMFIRRIIHNIDRL